MMMMMMMMKAMTMKRMMMSMMMMMMMTMMMMMMWMLHWTFDPSTFAKERETPGWQKVPLRGRSGCRSYVGVRYEQARRNGIAMNRLSKILPCDSSARGDAATAR